MSDSYLEVPVMEEDPLLSSDPAHGGPASEEGESGDKKRRLSLSEQEGKGEGEEAAGHRRPRILQSAIAAVVRPQSDLGPRGEDNYVSRASIQQAQAKPEAVSRNKRMLSSLLGHLGQAKRRLERDSSVIERQALRAAAAIERNRADSERVNKLNADKAREETNLRNAAIASQRKADISAASALWTRQLRASQTCYFTETSPRLAWLPGLVDEDFTALFDADKRKREVDAMIRSREEEDAHRIAAIDAELEAISTSASAELPHGPTAAPATSASGRDADDVAGEEKEEEEKEEDAFIQSGGSEAELSGRDREPEDRVDTEGGTGRGETTTDANVNES